MKNTLVTVLIPTYNRSGLLKEAIESILVQSYENIELVILDNASTDDTERIVKSFKDKRIRYVCSDNNLLPYGNFKKSLKFIRGGYFCWLTCDDYNDKRFVEKCVDYLENNDECAFVVTRTQPFKVAGGKKEFLPATKYPYLAGTGGKTDSTLILKEYLKLKYLQMRLPATMFRTDWYLIHDFELKDFKHSDPVLRLEQLLKCEYVGFIDESLHFARHHEKTYHHNDPLENRPIERAEIVFWTRNFIKKYHSQLALRKINILASYFYLFKRSLVLTARYQSIYGYIFNLRLFFALLFDLASNSVLTMFGYLIMIVSRFSRKFRRT